MSRSGIETWPLVRKAHPLLCWIGCWFGCGLVPKAPGTVGSIGALPLYFLLRSQGRWAVVAGAVILTLVGLWVSQKIAQASSCKDPQYVVIDEVVGMLVTLSVAPDNWYWALVGFGGFRLFDIVKPPPCRLIERKLPAAPSIMLDDIVAGLMAAVVLVAVHWLSATLWH